MPGEMRKVESRSIAQDTNTVDRRFDRRVGSLAESADRCVLHGQSDLVEQCHLATYAADRTTAGDSMQRLFLTHRSDAARHALAARLVAKERCDAAENLRHVDR